MKRIVGALTLMATILVMAPPGTTDRAFGQDTSTYSSKKVRRDLGEKGQIVIESLELNQADIGDVVRLLARLAGINIITGDIRGSITVYLESVTVQDAMEAILASQGYGFLFDGNIVRVVEASRLGEDRVETITETFLLNYLPAAEVANTLKNVFKGGQSMGGSFSQIEANVEANAVIVVDIPRKMEDIRRLIYILDRRFEQVEIEGRFIEISYTQDQQWGVDWQYFQDPANALDVNLAPQPLDAQNVAGQFKFAVISGSNNLNGFIQALETNNDIRILANPKILALENQPALIELIDEIPFVEANISQGVITESVQFQETGIRLQVTPSIAHDSDGTFVRMALDLEQRIPGPNVVLQNSIAFPIDSRHAKTDLIVPDDTTVVIGGLRSNDLTYTYEKIPFLGSVPFLGAPFRRRAKLDSQTELILFVTPRVIYSNPPLDLKEHELHDKIEEVIDSLETQAAWRERVEAPIDMLDKGILYSGVECNDERYDRVVDMKRTIEGVKPYRVSKPKGIRKVRIDETGQYVEEAEYVDENLESASESSSAQPGEVRDFSIIKEQARQGSGESGVKYLGDDEEAGGQVFFEELPPPPPLPEPPAPAAPSEDRERPSWLRRGTQSDAGEPFDLEAILSEDEDEDEVVEIEIVPPFFESDYESDYETTALAMPPLEVPPVAVEDAPSAMDPWGLPGGPLLELPDEDAEMTAPPKIEAAPPRIEEAPAKPAPVEKSREKSAAHPAEVPAPKPAVAAVVVEPPVSETPERIEPEKKVEVASEISNLPVTPPIPAGAAIVGMALPPKKETPSAPVVEPARAAPAAIPQPAPAPVIESQVTAAPAAIPKPAPAPVIASQVAAEAAAIPQPAPAPVIASQVTAAPAAPPVVAPKVVEAAPAPSAPVQAPEIINLTGLKPASIPRPVENKPEPTTRAVANSSPPAPAPESTAKALPVGPPQVAPDLSVVDLRGGSVVQKPEPDLRAFLDPTILDALKQIEAREGRPTAPAPAASAPSAPAPTLDPLDPWSPMASVGGATVASSFIPQYNGPSPTGSPDSVPLLAKNDSATSSDETAVTPAEGRSWWKKILGKD